MALSFEEVETRLSQLSASGYGPLDAGKLIEALLTDRLGATGKGLYEKVESVSDRIPEELQKHFGYLGSVRNDFAHNIDAVVRDADRFVSRAREVISWLNQQSPITPKPERSSVVQTSLRANSAPELAQRVPSSTNPNPVATASLAPTPLPPPAVQRHTFPASQRFSESPQRSVLFRVVAITACGALLPVALWMLLGAISITAAVGAQLLGIGLLIAGIVHGFREGFAGMLAGGFAGGIIGLLALPALANIIAGFIQKHQANIAANLAASSVVCALAAGLVSVLFYSRAIAGNLRRTNVRGRDVPIRLRWIVLVVVIVALGVRYWG